MNRLRKIVGKIVMWLIQWTDQLRLEHCEVCGRRVQLIWLADDGLWRRVTGHKNGGLYCARCFTEAAECLGLYLRWRPELDEAFYGEDE